MIPSNYRKRVQVFKPALKDAGGGAVYSDFESVGFMRADIRAVNAQAVKEKLEGLQNETVVTHSVFHMRRDFHIERDYQIDVVSPASDGRKFTVTLASPPNDPRGQHTLLCKERAT